MSQRKYPKHVPLSMVMPNMDDPEERLMWQLAEDIVKRVKEVTDKDQAIAGDIVTDLNFERPPQYFISPEDDITHLRIAIVEIEDPWDPEGPPKQMRDEVTVHGLKCPTCDNTDDKRGWNLDSPQGHPNRIIQCPNCGFVLWMVRGA